MTTSRYRSWGASRAGPLRLTYYPNNYPVHVTVRTFRRRPFFERRDLARIVFRILRSHERTLAAVLMPDHLHWVLDCAEKAPGAVADFKSLSTRLSWENGHQGRLWQRSYFDHLIRSSRGLEEAVGYLLANPIRAGLALGADEYPWSYDRFGLAAPEGARPRRTRATLR